MCYGYSKFTTTTQSQWSLFYSITKDNIITKNRCKHLLCKYVRLPESTLISSIVSYRIVPAECGESTVDDGAGVQSWWHAHLHLG